MEVPVLENDDVWHLREGVARPEDEVVLRYLAERDALINEEKMQRSDREFRENMSDVALKAAKIVDKIRRQEQETLWTTDYEESLAEEDGDIYPGMMFTLAKERMEKSRLFRIVRKMPKGALLHCHIEAMIEVKYILEDAFELDNIYLTSSQPLSTTEARRGASVSFVVSQDVLSTHSASIWSENYRREEPVLLNHAAKTFPGGKPAFVAWIESRCSITPSESLRHHDGPNEVWRKFISAFAVVRTIFYHPPIFRTCIRRLCEQLHADNVEWVDVRGVFCDPAHSLDEQKYVELIGMLGDEVETFKKSEEGRGFWGMRVIWTWVRLLSKQSIVLAMKQCIELKKAYPNLIAGFDFVGQEELGRPLKNLMPEILWFQKRCKEENLNIPFFFHAGETLGDGDETDENLFDAVLLGSRRIGHGFSLFKHPTLIEMVKERKILIESCPISNEVLRLTSSIKSHPLPALLARGVPCSLSNDDPAILGQGTAGMSHDFWQALQGWHNLGLAGLGSLAENSVRWAVFEDGTAEQWKKSIEEGYSGDGLRAQRMKDWHAAWEDFCQWVVDEMGTEPVVKDRQ